MSEERGLFIPAEVDTTRTRAGFNEIGQQADSMAGQVTRSGEQAQRSVSNIGAGAGRSAQSVETAQRNIIGSIQRTTAALEAGSRSGAEYYEVLARQRGVDPAVLAPYLAQLRAVEGAQGRAEMSTRAYSAAMRNVPAQITDIVTSLQGGMPPLTVAIQQGGQLRDMFGGIVPAARALSTQLLSMITPYTVVAAALAAVGIAYNQGSKEADAFRLSIVTTGNAAGVTTSQLAGMAKQASATAGTQGANAEALAALVGTGRIAASQLVASSIAAVSAQKYLGIAVADTVKAFSDLGSDPLKATLKLNEQYNYLTLSTYKQVKALEEQGKKSDAAKVAQTAYADMLSERSKKLEGSLGTLEKGWDLLGSSAKAAWDRMLDIGRETTLEDKIKAARQRLADAQKGIAAPPVISSTGMAPSLGFGTGQKETAAQAQKALDALLAQQDSEKRLAAIESERNRLSAAGVKWAEEGEQYLTRELGLKKAIKESQERGLAAGESDVDIAKRAMAIRAQYADVVNAGIEAQIAKVTRLGAIEEEAAKRARLILEGQQQVSGTQALDKRVEYAEKAAKLDEEALLRERARIQQRLTLTAGETVSDDQRAAQQQKLADMRGQIALVDEQILTRRAQLSKDLTAMDVADTNAAIESQERMLAARQADVDALRGQVRAQKDENATIGLSTQQAQAMNTQLVEERASRLEVNAAILDTIPGREAEAEAMRESARLMRELNAEQVIGANKKQSVDQWRDAVKQYDEVFRVGFAGMLNNGKSGWSSFTRSLTTTFKTTVADQIYKMLAQPFVVNLVGNILGVNGSGVAGATANSAISAAGSSLGIGASLGGTLGAIGSGAMQTAGAVLTGQIGLFDTVGAGISALSTGTLSGMTAGFSSLAGALGPIALGVAGIMALANKWDSSGTIHTGGAASASAAGVTNINAGTLGFQRIDTAEATNQLTSQLASSIVAILDSTATTFGKTAGYTAATAFADDTSKDGAWGALIISNLNGIVSQWGDANSKWAPKVFADGEVGQKEYLASISTSVRAALDGIGMPEWAKSMLDGLGASPALEDLAKVVDTINATQKALVLMGERLVGFAGQSDAAVSALIKASGGIDALATNAGAYYDAFYSEGEKAKVVTDQVAAALKAVGVQMPETRDAYRAQVEAQLALGAAGAPAVAALLANAQAFASVVPAVESATNAVKTQAEIASERLSLQDQLNQLTLTQEQLAAKARAAIDSHNQALYDQVQAAQVATQRRQMEIALMDAQGDKAGVLAANRAAELAAMDASLRPLQQQIYAQQDIVAAAQKAANILSLQAQMYEATGDKAGAAAVLEQQHQAALVGLTPAVAAATQAMWAAQAAEKARQEELQRSNALLDIQAQIAQATGDKAGAAAILQQQHVAALAAMDPALRAATEQLWAAQAASNATKAALDAVDTAYNSLQAVIQRQRDALNASYQNSIDEIEYGVGKITDSISDLKSLSQDLHSTLDGLSVPGQEKDERAAAQAQIAAALAIAKVGGPLPSDDALKKALATVGKDSSQQFGSYLDYQRDLYTTKNNLAQLADLTDDQLSTDEKQLKVFQDQRADLEAAHKEDLARLDATLEQARVQSELMRGIYTSVLTIPQALASFQAAVGAANANPGVSNTNSIASLYQSLLGRAPDADGLAFYQAQIAKGDSLDKIADYIKNSPEYQKLHPFAVGTNYVPGDMPALIHEGERIIPAADNRLLMSRLSSPANNNAELVAEMREMRREIAQLRTAASRTADASEEGTGLFKRVIRNDRLYTSSKVEVAA